MNNKRSKKESKALPACKCSTDCWCTILSFLPAKDHCRVLCTCKVVSAAGRNRQSWSPAVEAPTPAIATQLQAQGCTAPPHELRLGFVPAAWAWVPGGGDHPELKDWITAKLETLHFEVDARRTALQLACASVAPSLRRLSVSVTRNDLYWTTGAVFLWNGTESTEQVHYTDTLQALVLSRFAFQAGAVADIKWRNLTVLRLEECTHPRRGVGSIWDLLDGLANQLVELGTPKLRTTEGDNHVDLYNVLPMSTMSSLIYLWGHVGPHEQPDMFATLLDRFLPNLQRLYVIPPSVNELKQLEGGEMYPNNFFRDMRKHVQKGCGLVQYGDYPGDFEVDEAVHRKLGNWGKLVNGEPQYSVKVVYTTKPRARSPFDLID